MAEPQAEQMASLDINSEGTNAEDEDFVDPWNVQSSSATGVDYQKLIGQPYLKHQKTTKGRKKEIVAGTAIQLFIHCILLGKIADIGPTHVSLHN